MGMEMNVDNRKWRTAAVNDLVAGKSMFRKLCEQSFVHFPRRKSVLLFRIVHWQQQQLIAVKYSCRS